MAITLVFPGLGPDRPAGSRRLEMLLPFPVRVDKGGVIARTAQGGDGVLPSLTFDGKIDDLVGEGVAVASENPLVLQAARAGYLADREGSLVVTKIVEIFRDIDNQSGDYEGIGPVRIHGGVLSGRSVTVEGDLEILGLVEGARVKATGNLLLRGGIAGGDEGHASAGKDLLASYAQQASLEAVGSIVLEGPSMNAHLAAGKKVALKGRAGVVGGGVRAREEIIAPVVGSESAVPTDIALGYDPFQSRLVKELSAEREALDDADVMAEKAADFAVHRLENRPPMVKGDLLSNIFAHTDLVRRENEEGLPEEEVKYRKELANALMERLHIDLQRQGLEESVSDRAAPYSGASLKVERIAHPGVTISIMAHTLLLDREYERVKFIIKGDGIEPVYL